MIHTIFTGEERRVCRLRGGEGTSYGVTLQWNVQVFGHQKFFAEVTNTILSKGSIVRVGTCLPSICPGFDFGWESCGLSFLLLLMSCFKVFFFFSTFPNFLPGSSKTNVTKFQFSDLNGRPI